MGSEARAGQPHVEEEKVGASSETMRSWGSRGRVSAVERSFGFCSLPPHKHVSNCGQDPPKRENRWVPTQGSGGPREHSEEKPRPITEEPLVRHRCPLESWEADGTAEGLLGRAALAERRPCARGRRQEGTWLKDELKTEGRGCTWHLPPDTRGTYLFKSGSSLGQSWE